MLEGLLELLEKVIPGSEGNGSAVDSVFLESFGPSLGRSFSHIQEGKGNFLHVVAVRGLVDRKVELNGVHPGDSCFIGAIEGFRLAKLKFSRFDSGRQHGGRNRWARVGR